MFGAVEVNTFVSPPLLLEIVIQPSGSVGRRRFGTPEVNTFIAPSLFLEIVTSSVLVDRRGEAKTLVDSIIIAVAKQITFLNNIVNPSLTTLII